MIAFQELNFDPVKEILKIQFHIYILMKKVIILRKIHVKMKSFTPQWKETKHIHTSAAGFVTYNMRIENLDWSKCQKQPLEVFCEKRWSLNVAKFTRNSCARGNTCQFCKNFKNIFYRTTLDDCLWNAGISMMQWEI